MPDRPLDRDTTDDDGGPNVSRRWSVVVHADAGSTYDEAERVAAAMESAAKRNGARDLMVEVHEPDADR